MDRKTFVQELPKLQVNKNPAPGTYNPKIVDARVIGPPKSTTPIAQFINEAEYRGLETSSPGQYNAKFHLVEDKIKGMKFESQSKGVKSFIEQSKSKVNLSPGQYNPGPAFDKF